MDWNGKDIEIWNLHMEAFSQRTRFEQTMKLASLVSANKSMPKIVLGDFNSITFFDPDVTEKLKVDFRKRQQSVRYFREHSRLMNAEEMEVKFCTIPSWQPQRKIDHIFYSNQFRLDKVDAISLEASDHLPVWAIFNVD